MQQDVTLRAPYRFAGARMARGLRNGNGRPWGRPFGDAVRRGAGWRFYFSTSVPRMIDAWPGKEQMYV